MLSLLANPQVAVQNAIGILAGVVVLCVAAAVIMATLSLWFYDRDLDSPDARRTTWVRRDHDRRPVTL